MTVHELAERLHDGRPCFGTLIVSPSPRWPQSVAGAGLDFVFIDTEHIALGRQELSWMCQTYAALGLPPIVRIPSPDHYTATMVLDGGAVGIVAPYVETVQQVQALRGAVKCRPIKGRKLSRHLTGEESFTGELAKYVQRGNAGHLLILNIESVPAMENLDAILAVPDIDAVLIGPHDLSCSLGVPEQYDHPAFEAACREIFRKARAARVGAGFHCFYGNLPQEKAWITEAGANLIIHGADIIAFAKTMGGEIGDLRRTAGATKRSAENAINI